MKKVITTLMMLLILTGCGKKEEVKEEPIELNDTIYCAESTLQYDNCILFHNNMIKTGNFNYFQNDKNREEDNYKVYNYEIKDNKIISDITLNYDIETDTIEHNDTKYSKENYNSIKEQIDIIDNMLYPNQVYCTKSLSGNRNSEYGCYLFHYDGTYSEVYVENDKIYIKDYKNLTNNQPTIHEFNENNVIKHGTYYFSENDNEIIYYRPINRVYYTFDYENTNNEITITNLERCTTILNCFE